MPTTLADIPTNYRAMETYLGNKDERPAGNNTRIKRVNYHDAETEAMVMILHRTPVVWLWSDNTATLNTDGWETVTTKDRINRVIGDHGWTLYQEDWTWYLWDRDNDIVCRYHDGIVISLNRNEEDRIYSPVSREEK